LSKTIVLTGFEPFGESQVNPSLIACNAFDRLKIKGYSIKAFEIPLVFEEIKEKIEEIIKENNPVAVISTGQSPRATISLERIAINIADVSRTAYNCESKPMDQILESNGPDGYFSTLPIRKIKEQLDENRIPTNISNSAGTFGCNQIFYHSMHYLHSKNYNIPAGFVHVPSLPEQVVGKNIPSMSLETIKEGIKIILETLIDEIVRE